MTEPHIGVEECRNATRAVHPYAYSGRFANGKCYVASSRGGSILAIAMSEEEAWLMASREAQAMRTLSARINFPHVKVGEDGTKGEDALWVSQ